jgi:ABC-type branched-subunit amino acid transport system ATPase component/ABC-type branched-subunit amino acid transport system permease subunit
VFRRFAFGGLSPFAAVLFCTALGLALQNYFKYVIAIVLVSMVIGVALVVLVGLARCITLATGAVMAIGAYTSTLLMTRIGIPYLIGLFCAAATGALAGWLIALPGTRFRGHNLAMVTLVFQAVAIILLREAKWLTGGAEGIHVPQPVIFGWRVATDADFLVLIGLLSALVILLVTILTRGPFGKNLQAASGNEIAAEAFGVSVPAYLRAAFVISSMVIGFSGALAAPRIRILDPESFGVLPSIFMLAYPIVGGMQSVWGGLLGGGGLRILPELLRPVADFQELFFASLVIAVVMFFPGGMVELLRRSTGRVFSRRNKQRAGEAPLLPAIIPAEPTVHDWPTVPANSSEVLLRVEGIDRHFGALHAVNAASITVPIGGIHGLIGPNGAGKTSLFNIISGFLEAEQGHIDFAGTSLLDRPARDRIALGITRTFQHVAVFGQLSCLENVIIGRGRNAVMDSIKQSFDHFVGGRAREAAIRDALAALDAVGLADQASMPASSLSLGNQRRLELARAIVSNPRLILLDEPVSGLASAEVEELRQLLLRTNAERQIAMLVVEHNIPFVAKLCRTLSVMGAGAIVAEGNPEEVIARPGVRQLYFGEAAA